MQSPTELLLVKGFTYEIYEKLEAAITVLPETTEINVNTATALVYQSLIEDFTAADAQKLIEARNKEPFKKIEDFLSHDLVKGKKVSTAGLSVSSRYFVVNALAEIGRAHSQMQSILNRADEKSVRVVLRSQGGL
jgi:general secretion pathway protein K